MTDTALRSRIDAAFERRAELDAATLAALRPDVEAAIDAIADESRRLNYALGKKVVSRQGFQRLLSGLAIPADITEEGGLWAVIQK